MTTTPATLAATRLASTKLTGHPLAPRHLRKTADWLSPTATGRGKASPPRAGTPCSFLSCHAESPPVTLAPPQRTFVWKRRRSVAHTLQKERRLMSENSVLWALITKTLTDCAYHGFRISVYHASMRRHMCEDNEEVTQTDHHRITLQENTVICPGANEYLLFFGP